MGFVENNGQVIDQYGKPNLLAKYTLLLPHGLKVVVREDGFSYETYTSSPKTGPLTKFSGKLPGRHNFDVLTNLKCHRVDVLLSGSNIHPQIVPEERLTTVNYYTPGTGAAGTRASIFRKVTLKNIYDGIDLVFTANSSDTLSPFEYYFVVNPKSDAGKIRLSYHGALKTALDDNQIAISVNRGTFKERIPDSYITDSGVSTSTKRGYSRNKINVSYQSLGKNQYRFHIPKYDVTKTLIIDPTPDLIWGTYYGGYANEFAEAIAKDANSNLYICGNSDGSSLATSGAFQTVLDGPSDALIAKFDNGGSLLWVTYFGGNSFEDATGIKVDHDGNVVVTGQTFSSDVIASPGAFETHNHSEPGGRASAFVLKMDPSGARIWSTFFAGNYAEVAYAIDVDSKNNIFITGYTESESELATPGAHQTVWAGDTVLRFPDAFLAKFDKNGARIWATYYGGTQTDMALGVCVDQQDNVLIAGTTSSKSAISTTGAWQTIIDSAAQAPGDAFLSKFDNNGNLLWGTYYGGTGDDAAYCITIDEANNIVVGGLTNSANNMATPGAQQITRSAVIGIDFEAFVAKFSSGGQRIWGSYYGNGGSDIVQCIATDDQNNIYLGGQSASTINITTSASYQPQPQSPTTNAFLSKMNSSGILQWGTFYGVPGGGWTAGIVHLPDGGTAVTGITLSTTGIATCGAVQMNYMGENDIFLGKFGEKTVTPAPSVNIANATSGPICPNTPITFIATADNGGTSPAFEWLVNGIPVGGDAPSFTASNLANGDLVTCFLTSNSACVTSDTATSNAIGVSIVTPTTPQIAISTSTDSICLGSLANFAANATTLSQTPVYQWAVNGANAGSGGPSFSSTSLADGDLVSCSVSDNACNVSTTGLSNEIKMFVNSNILTPSIAIDASPDAVCAGKAVTFNAAISDAGTDPGYQWVINGIPVGGDSGVFQSAALLDGDRVACQLTPAKNVCWSISPALSNAVQMTVYPVPQLIFSPADTSIFAGSSIQLKPSITGDVSAYEWVPANTLNNPGMEDPIALPDSSTIYALTITSVNGCQASAKIEVDVLRSLHMPNAFTPDQTGKNSIFRLPAFSALTLKDFSVYNRWGTRVFSTSDPKIGWDGTFKEKPCTAGVYVYFVAGSDKNGPVAVQGTVILIR